MLGSPDGRITARAGLHLVSKLDQLLGISARIDVGGAGFKSRRRGLRLGGLVVSLAETMLAGGDFLIDLDHQRRDSAGLRLRAVRDVPASTTAIGLGKRFDETAARSVEEANASLVKSAFHLLPTKRKEELCAARPTIDLDPTDVEVYGRSKAGSAYNYAGQRAYRPHPAVWAEAGWALAAELGSGKDDPRPQAPSLIRRAVVALPGGLLPPIVRGDSGFFDAKVAYAAVGAGADFAIAAKRNVAVWRAERQIPADAWRKAIAMDAEVAACDYVPAGWPEGSRTICRRVKIRADELSGDTRSRRRRTIDPNQLALLESKETGFAYAYSFIVTNLDGDICEIEAWFRRRALIEKKIKDSKLGLALRHLPSGYEAVNSMWMWAARRPQHLFLAAGPQRPRRQRRPCARQTSAPRVGLRRGEGDPPQPADRGSCGARRCNRCLRRRLAGARSTPPERKPVTPGVPRGRIRGATTRRSPAPE